jgi:signal transduction histidine kinase/ligand-binding sensor domain-containing protein
MKILYLFFIILIPSLLSADSPPEDLHHAVLSTWTTAQGLPQNFITAIDQTPDGFLWVGTLEGLARFDGLQFQTFGRSLPAPLHGDISGLAHDANGVLWIGSDKGLFVYVRRHFDIAPGFKGNPLTHIEKINVARGGGVWVRTRDRLFYATLSSVREIALPMAIPDLRSFTEDNQGNLWLTDGRTVVVSSEGRTVARYPLKNATLLYSAPDGMIYAGNGHQLFVFADGKFTRVAKTGPSEFVGMMIDSKKRLWMASGGLEGISCKSETGVQMLTSADGLASNDARILFEDHSGDIWIGTISGLQRLHKGIFTSFSERDGLIRGPKQYDSIFEDKHGAIWVGAIESGVSRWEGNRWLSFGREAGLRSGQVRGFVDSESPGADGKPIIAISDYGLFRFKDGRFRAIPHIPTGYIASPIRTRDGNLWFSIPQKGVYRLKDGVLTSFGPADGLTDNSIWALLPDEDGSIWAGASTGLFHWKEGRWSQEIATDGKVVSIFHSKRFGMLVGTSNGIVMVRDGHRWSITQESGLPARMVLSIVEDDMANLWLAAANSICLIPHEQVESIISGASKTISPEIFTETDGLHSPNVLPLPQVSSLRTRNGRIWFATAEGPAVVASGLQRTEQANAVLEFITIDDQQYDAQALIVPPGRHRVTFKFTAPVFIAPEQVSFRYRLNGWDSDWVDAGTQRTASYTGLPPGSYVFHVQAIARGGILGGITRGVKLKLKPYFWQTRTFKCSVVVIAMAIIVEFTRRRTLRRFERLRLRFEERASERERIAYQMHDTVIQDLIGATLQLEVLVFQLSSGTTAAQQSLEAIASRLRSTIARSRDLVSNLHSTSSPQYSLYDVLRVCETEFRVGHQPELRIVSESEPRVIDPFLRDEIYRICREAVANAFRHAKAQVIQVKIQYEKVWLTIDIVDDGCGMDEKTNHFGHSGHFGLRGMRAHARQIGAEFSVTSVLGGGTHVRLRTKIAQGWKERMQARFATWRKPLDVFDSAINAKVDDEFEQ